MKNLANPLLSIFFGNRKKDLDDDVTTTYPNSLALGRVWQGPQALKAYKGGNLFSNRTGHPIRICMRHLVEDKEEVDGLHQPRNKKSVWVSWVDDQGTLHTFRKLEPVIKSSVDCKTPTENDHIEKSFLGHAFIFVVRETEDDDDDDDDDEEWQAKSLDEATVIGGYRPQLLSTDPDIREDDYPCHMLEIAEEKTPKFLRCSCQPTTAKPSTGDFPLVVREGNCLEPLDTTNKEYIEEKIARWPVCVEKDCFANDKQLKEVVKKDLEYAISCLPGHAQKALKESQTRIYVNKSFDYGPKIRPIKAKGLCFHPNRKWLVDHGYLPDKTKCVELYDTSDYTKYSKLWGRGGVFLHELAHAYHNRVLPDGYQNVDVIACYELAMEEGLYSRVKVHGPQGPTAPAYACENACEYFAELSTAFLGGKKDNEEYNKWYPFNRAQLLEHDPRAYKLLCKLWKVRP